MIPTTYRDCDWLAVRTRPPRIPAPNRHPALMPLIATKETTKLTKARPPEKLPLWSDKFGEELTPEQVAVPHDGTVRTYCASGLYRCSQLDKRGAKFECWHYDVAIGTNTGRPMRCGECLNCEGRIEVDG